MKLKDILSNAQKILSDAVVAEKAGDLKEVHAKIEMLHMVMHEPEDLPEAEQPAAAGIAVEQPAAETKVENCTSEQPAAEQPATEKPGVKPWQKPKSKEGAGIVSEPAEPAKKDTGVNEGSGKVSTPDESQNKEGSGVV